LIKFLSGSNTCGSLWEWVKGHAVERKGWRNCTLPKRLNDQADKLAKDALISAISGGSTIEGDLAFEVVKFSFLGNQVHGSPRQALEVDWGYCAAQALYDTKNIIRSEVFHLVWWDGLSTVISHYPKMYRVWLTKHVSDFCGNNVQFYYWSKGTHSPKCECCGIKDKYTIHICRCLDPGHNEMFQILVGELISWLIETLGKHSVALIVEMYLLARGEAKMSCCDHGANFNLVTLSVQTNCLSWDSFLEGCLSSHWSTVAAPLLWQWSQYLLPLAWGHLLISKLHNVIHKQWVYRNSYIYFKGNNGLTMPEQHMTSSTE
jgi:hypothetical protein